MTLTVGSLFSGIGGIDLGLERAGMQVIWQSEIDPYCSRVLAKHWPSVPNLGDITTIDWGTVERPDVICGGYPCQPWSYAGVRRGENDPRHLWPHMLTAIRRLRPRFALLENVPGHLSMGFGRVLGDLAESGYDTQWDCIPATAVGAPHRRDRVFIVAYPQRDELRLEPVGVARGGDTSVAGNDGTQCDVADTDGEGWGPGEYELPGCIAAQGPSRPIVQSRGRCLGEPWPRPGHAPDWAVEPDVGRVAHGVPNRMDRLKGLGNAVVPQVAEYVGRMIMAIA